MDLSETLERVEIDLEVALVHLGQAQERVAELTAVRDGLRVAIQRYAEPTPPEVVPGSEQAETEAAPAGDIGPALWWQRTSAWPGAYESEATRQLTAIIADAVRPVDEAARRIIWGAATRPFSALDEEARRFALGDAARMGERWADALRLNPALFASAGQVVPPTTAVASAHGHLDIGGTAVASRGEVDALWGDLRPGRAVERALLELQRRVSTSDLVEFLQSKGREDTPGEVRNALYYMERNGKVVKVGRGRWALPDASDGAPDGEASDAAHNVDPVHFPDNLERDGVSKAP
jgi:hypothetical protein